MTKRSKQKVRTGEGLVSTQIRWPMDWLDRIDALRGDDERAAFVRGVVYLVLSGRYEVVRDSEGNVASLKKRSASDLAAISDPPARGRPRTIEEDE